MDELSAKQDGISLINEETFTIYDKYFSKFSILFIEFIKILKNSFIEYVFPQIIIIYPGILTAIIISAFAYIFKLFVDRLEAKKINYRLKNTDYYKYYYWNRFTARKTGKASVIMRMISKDDVLIETKEDFYPGTNKFRGTLKITGDVIYVHTYFDQLKSYNFWTFHRMPDQHDVLVGIYTGLSRNRDIVSSPCILSRRALSLDEIGEIMGKNNLKITVRHATFVAERFSSD